MKPERPGGTPPMGVHNRSLEPQLGTLRGMLCAGCPSLEASKAQPAVPGRQAGSCLSAAALVGAAARP